MNNAGEAAVHPMIMRSLLLMCSLFPVAAGASISAPNSFVKWSSDRTRVLIMLSPDPDNDRNPSEMFPDGRLINLHDYFCSSGVYDAVTFAPVWQADWYSLGGYYRASDDLRYVVRLHMRAFDSGNCAIEFYDNGKLIRSYWCSELLTGMTHPAFLAYTSANWHTQWYEDFELGENHNQLQFSTARRETRLPGFKLNLGLQEFYTFDLASGQIVSKRTEGSWIIWAYGTTIIFVIGSVLFLGRLGWRRLKSLRRFRGFPIVPLTGGPKN